MNDSWETLPGETPIDDVSGLKVKGITTRKELALAEAKNIRKPTIKYLAVKPTPKKTPFDLAWSLKLHGEMFGEVWEWAGKVRQKELNLGVPFHQVTSELMQVFENLKYWEEHWEDVLEQAVHLHHQTVRIHPFLNGNGRWARMLSNIWLRLHDEPLVIWPSSMDAISEIRDEYIESIQTADQGTMQPLIDLHRRFQEQKG